MTDTCNRANELYVACPSIEGWSWPNGSLSMHSTEPPYGCQGRTMGLRTTGGGEAASLSGDDSVEALLASTMPRTAPKRRPKDVPRRAEAFGAPQGQKHQRRMKTALQPKA